MNSLYMVEGELGQSEERFLSNEQIPASGMENEDFCMLGLGGEKDTAVS